MSKQRKKYYAYSPEAVGFREVRWLRVKIAGSVIASVACIVLAILAFNHFYVDFLGFGRDQISTLKRENALLEHQLTSMNSHMKELETTLTDLQKEDNHVRSRNFKTQGSGLAPKQCAEFECEGLQNLLSGARVLRPYR